MVMLPGGAFVFKTPFTSVQPCTMLAGRRLEVSVLVRLEVAGAGVFGGPVRSLNDEKAVALDGRVERATGGLNARLA